MIFDFIEAFNDNMVVLFLFVIGIACAAGGIPPMIERSRRRGIENQLPGLLESLSDAVGAGRGLQEAMLEQGRNTPGVLGNKLSDLRTIKGANILSTSYSSLISA